MEVRMLQNNQILKKEIHYDDSEIKKIFRFR